MHTPVSLLLCELGRRREIVHCRDPALKPALAPPQVTGMALSPRHPYLFSCGLDKQVKCWDLEYNKV